MNYYPNNFYGNYPYGGTYPQVQQSTPTAANPYNQSYLTNTLLGKVVDGEEIVKATEVPFGGYGVFPKADLSEIYIKSWNNDGTTKVVKFQPIALQEQSEQPDVNAILLEKITNIETKLESLTQVKSAPVQNSTIIEKRKELNVSAY